MGLLGPKEGAQGGAQGSPPKGLYKQRGRLKTLTLATVPATVAASFLAAPPVRQALGRPRGPSSPDCGASSRTCGLRGGDALAAQGQAVCEVVNATALPASICTTPTRYRSSATARLVVIP